MTCSEQNIDWPFGDLQVFGFDAILADPPWEFQLWSGKGEGKSAQAKYECMATDEICALPVSHLASRNCLLMMWATFPMLPDAFRVMEAWHFRYVSGGAWHKMSSTGNKTAFGTGYVLRSAAEVFLIGVTGQPDLQSRAVRNLIQAPVRSHSRKPDAAYELVEALVAGPKLELFSRQSRPGWESWGKEAGKFDHEIGDQKP